MRVWQIIGLSFYQLLCLVLAVIGAPIVCMFARWDDDVTTWTGGAPRNGPPTVRGDLPAWAWPWETIDERLPGGMYEPTVVAVHRRFGRYWCSVYWLCRNRMMGLTKRLFGRPLRVDEPARGMRWVEFGLVKAGAGWKKYRATPQAHWIYGPFVEMPSVTVRLCNNK